MKFAYGGMAGSTPGFTDPRHTDHGGAIPIHIATRLRVHLIGTALAMSPLVISSRLVAQQRIAYPPAERGKVVDTYFGTAVPDPYRWMEDLDSRKTRAWVATENAFTNAYLAQFPLRDSVRARLTQLYNYARTRPPTVLPNGTLFYLRNTGLQDQYVVYMRAGLKGRPVVALDPNTLSGDGSIALGRWAPSPDGRFLAYGLSQGGADWNTIHVRDLTTMRDLADTVSWARFSDISWTRDARGFFYSRYPTPPKGKELSAALLNHSVYYHTIGTPQSRDRLIFAPAELPRYFVGCTVADDGRYLFCSASPGADDRNRLYFADMGDPMRPNVAAPLTTIVGEDIAQFEPIGNSGSTAYILTNDGAPLHRVVSLDLAAQPDRAHMRTVVPESRYAVESAIMAGGRLVLEYLEDVKSIVRVFEPDGRPVGAILLPNVGSVFGLSGRSDATTMFYGFDSPLSPETVYAFNVKSREQVAFEPPTPVFNAASYETREVFATSRDGTKIPVFVTMKKGTVLDGSHPTFLTAYGGFAVSAQPHFSPEIPAWLERGGIYVSAALRGGGEYGEVWHRSGMRERKQNVFDDFIGVAEYLVRERYTSPARLVMAGGSNGGLLVGAVTTQRPDLFAVALPGVGVMDMLRYDRFTGGAGWITEYGSSSDSTMFPYLLRYSPLQNIKPGVCYPATLATTADHDDRVVPSHTYKYVATLQAAQGCGRLVLMRVETHASHGYRTTTQRIAEAADKLTFALLGVR